MQETNRADDSQLRAWQESFDAVVREQGIDLGGKKDVTVQGIAVKNTAK